MKKEKTPVVIPDSLREELDFLGRVYCPLKERFSQAYYAFEADYNQSHEPKLRGVSPTGKGGGADHDMYNNLTTIQTKEKFPAVVTDIGYGEFFTGDFLATSEKHAWFAPVPTPQPVHPLFRNLDLQDPKGIFSIYGAMPYVLLVNHKRLKGRPVPRRISDLSAPEYVKSVAAGYAPDDITELLLLEIWKEQGEQGIHALARNIGLAGRAPEMAADAIAPREGCCVYVMSWFFAHAVPKRDYLEILWPEDGALFCPLYGITKVDGDERQKACVDFLFSAELGRTLVAGRFAHINPLVHHPTPDGAAFRWVGWEYLYEKNITERVREIEAVYYGIKIA
ncbi:MAG: ABC transporter substrate-binding protein [Treponema sp.]|jgi:ABC-type Fe3+ transport system substrate-binding protein|nr:ABC transporter substrate-binding protein [Treponema sp.]